MHRRFFHGFFILIFFSSLSSITIAFNKANALGAVQSDDPQSETWQSPELLKLAREFRRWHRSFQEGIPDYIQMVKEQLVTRSLVQQFVYSKITLLTPEVEAQIATLLGEGNSVVEAAKILTETTGQKWTHQRVNAILRSTQTE